MDAVHGLDLDTMGDLGLRARAMFDDKILRAYSAALVARLTQRVPFGANNGKPLQANVTREVAENGSKDRALFVSVDYDSIVPAPVVFSAGPNIGANDFGTIQNQGGGVPPSLFILLPSERLFMQSTIAGRAIVTQEWF